MDTIIKRYYMILTAILFAFVLMGASSCSTKVVSDRIAPPCTAKMKNFELKWGETTASTGLELAYKLNYLGELSMIVNEKNAKEKIEEIGTVPADEYCKLVRKTVDTFVKIQALNAPGDKSQFIEYIDPDRNIVNRALWNPEFKTFGSKEFRSLYDSLQLLVEEAILK